MLSDSHRRRLRDAIRKEVPDQPGVYTWLGEAGEPLYVGKSVSLRTRMLSYLTPAQAGPHSRIRQLASAIHGFEHRQTAGELLALLVEDAVIKQLRPRHNVRQRDYLERRYLLLTHDPFPTCLVVEAEPARPGTLFGPFKDQYFVAELIGLINDEFGLRACPDRVPFRRSARFDLGTCPGPCRDAVTAGDYAPIAERVRAFLGGDESWIAQRLRSEMERASRALRFERAAQAKERLAFSRRFAARQRLIRDFREDTTTVREATFGLTYRFERGQVVDITDDVGTAVALPLEITGSLEDPRFVLDRANLVYAWRQRRSSAGGPTL